MVLPRRCYKFRDGEGGWSPLEEKLGLDRCLGYSPLMSYLLTCFGGSEAYARGAEMLSEALGFGVSATAVQRNTEAVGERITDNPYQMISAQKAQQECELMVVEVDGTISPQTMGTTIRVLSGHSKRLAGRARPECGCNPSQAS